jgi:hypothetical protein
MKAPCGRRGDCSCNRDDDRRCGPLATAVVAVSMVGASVVFMAALAAFGEATPRCVAALSPDLVGMAAGMAAIASSAATAMGAMVVGLWSLL